MIYLLRHGLDDESYIGGWSDVELTDEGIEQVNGVSLYLKENNYCIKKIYTSDIKRALMTAEIVSNHLGIDIEETDKLRELDKGLLTKLPKKEIYKYPEFIGDLLVDKRYPNGESLVDLYNRIKEVLTTDIFKEDNVLIITHRGVINMIYTIISESLLDNNKKKYGVTHASLHQLDLSNKTIQKIR